MPASLILNADDFGLTPGINRAIAELHAAGALTSATLMANGPAFDHAVATAHAHPTLGVGAHIVLIDGTPISSPADIPSLIGPDGRSFRNSLARFHLDVLRGRIRAADIVREATAQIRKLQRSGIRVTHLDTHKHTHILPAVARPLLSVADATSVPAIRNPFEQPWSLRIARSGFMRRLQVALMSRLQPHFENLPQLRSGAVRTTAGTIGISATGSLDQPTLLTTLAALPPTGIFELVLHPGYNDPDLDAITTRLRASREIERHALLSVFAENSSHLSFPPLIHYGNLNRPTPVSTI